MATAKDNSPLVSIILPLFNGELYISKCLDSILAQTYSNYEILICNDASTDRSFDIAQDYSAKYPDKIYLYNHPDNANHGISRTRNLCISHSKGKYLAFIDQDDYWYKDKLQIQIDAFSSNPHAVLSYGKTALLYSDNKDLPSSEEIITGKKVPRGRLRSFFYLLSENRIYHCTCMADRNAFQAIGLFPENQLFYEDWLCLLRLTFFGDFLYSDQVLSGYRIHSQSTSEIYKSDVRTLENEITLIINLYSFLRKRRLLRGLLYSFSMQFSIARALFRASSHRIDYSLITTSAHRLRSSLSPNRLFISLLLFFLRITPFSMFVIFRKFRRRIIGV